MAKLQHDPEKLPQGNREPFLQVIDARYDEKKMQWSTELGFDATTDTITRIPSHEPGIARIFDVSFPFGSGITGLTYAKKDNAPHPENDNLLRHLNDTYINQVVPQSQEDPVAPVVPLENKKVVKWSKDPVLVNDIGSISAQWSQSLDSEQYLYRLVNRTIRQEHPSDHKIHPRNTYLTCVQTSGNRLIVLIANESCSDQPRRISRLLGEKSWTSLSNGTVDMFAKFQVLDFLLSSIYLQPMDFYRSLEIPELLDEGSIQPSLDNSGLQAPLGMSTPRLSTHIGTAFKEIEKADDLVGSVANVVEPIRFVTEVIAKEPLEDDPEKPWPYRREFKRRMQELRELCKQRGNNVQRNLEGLNRQLDHFTKAKQIREADLVRILTILASIYLPLSLAASLLGMQYPFKLVAHDHVPDGDGRYLVGTNLLFDFFGVSIGLGTVTVFIFWTIRAIMWCRSKGVERLLSNKSVGQHSTFLYERRWRNHDRRSRFFSFIYGLTGLWIGAGFLLALPAVFLVGMLSSAQNAWDAAKWTFTAYAAGGGALIFAFLATYGCFYYAGNQRQD